MLASWVYSYLLLIITAISAAANTAMIIMSAEREKFKP